MNIHFKKQTFGTYIPDLKFDRFAVELNCSYLEINANGADITFCISVISKPQQ